MSRLPVLKMHKLFIGGKFTRTESERYLSVVNTSTKKKACNISRGSRKDIRNAVSAARAGYEAWSSKTDYERGQIMYRLAEMLESGRAQIENELLNCTTYSRARASKEVLKSIDRIIWYAGFADKWAQLVGTVNSVQSGYFNFSIPEPTGVVGIILPEDAPFISLVTRICSVIVSGNSCVVIPSEKSPLPALAFAEIIGTSDAPFGIINIVTGIKKELLTHLAGHMDVNAIDYADNDKTTKEMIKKECSRNVKRFTGSYSNDYFNDEEHETLRNIENFTELKTVWHTMGT